MAIWWPNEPKQRRQPDGHALCLKTGLMVFGLASVRTQCSAITLRLLPHNDRSSDATVNPTFSFEASTKGSSTGCVYS